jgi:hypothetical protein
MHVAHAQAETERGDVCRTIEKYKKLENPWNDIRLQWVVLRRSLYRKKEERAKRRGIVYNKTIKTL